MGGALQLLREATSDDHLAVNPHGKWQAECTATNVHEASLSLTARELASVAAQTFRMQHHICMVLRSRVPDFNFVALFSARIRVIISRSLLLLDPFVLGASLKATLELAAVVLSPGLLTSTLRLGTNSWATSHGNGNVAESCPFCGAAAADRVSHYIQCGAIYVWIEESVPDIHWPLDDSLGRVRAFFGGCDSTPDQSAATTIP
jgi:hypothetical protein